MFGRRSDGVLLKKLPIIFKLMPSVMKERNDSQVLFKQDVPIKEIEKYIDLKAKEGIKLSVMDVVLAAIVRIINERPQLNRFCVNGRTYARNTLSISLAIKKSLEDDGEETNLKFLFTGKENIFEVKEITEKLIKENKKVEVQNGIDKLANALGALPYGIIIPLVSFLKWLDKYRIITK